MGCRCLIRRDGGGGAIRKILGSPQSPGGADAGGQILCSQRRWGGWRVWSPDDFLTLASSKWAWGPAEPLSETTGFDSKNAPFSTWRGAGSCLWLE